ncbi:MAG TPA: hypothetical protein VEV41_11225 [Terriglobales bacterium]|jgi:hypothetical protein|nr:hypothetical protein [Terriglobales bacterium]
MPSHDPGPLLDPPERTRDSLDSLETRFRRAYGRDMRPEERKYFALVEPIARFDPNAKTGQPEAVESKPTVESKPEEPPATSDAEIADVPESHPPKAA